MQLVVEGHDVSLPTVGDLLERMFKEQKLHFTKVYVEEVITVWSLICMSDI